MEILAGIFVLFCVGVITGYSLIFVRSHDAPKKEPAAQVMIQENHDARRAAATPSEGAKDGEKNLPGEQKSTDLPQEK